MQLTFFIAIFVIFQVTTCVKHSESLPIEAPLSCWPTTSRQNFWNERITVQFKAGNTRYGKLALNDNPCVVSLIETDDAGIYVLEEILWIKLQSKVIYPNNLDL